MKRLDKMSRTVGYLEKIFTHLNMRYFENSLSMPIITVMSTPMAYGHMSILKIWKKGDETQREINIGAGTLDRPIEEVVATICHEMVLLFELQKTLKSCAYKKTVKK